MTAKPLARLTMRLACAALIVGGFLNLSDADRQLQVQAHDRGDSAKTIGAQTAVKTSNHFTNKMD